jgi:hypothetical protein
LTVPAAESVKPVEVVAASEKEVSIPEEVKEVVSVPESAKPLRVSNDLARAGVVLAGASAPVPKTTIGDVKLPMTYADALATEKRTRFWQALHWLAAYIAYQWRKLDPSLKA